jgi:hypothetical protein
MAVFRTQEQANQVPAKPMSDTFLVFAAATNAVSILYVMVLAIRG